MGYETLVAVYDTKAPRRCSCQSPKGCRVRCIRHQHF